MSPHPIPSLSGFNPIMSRRVLFGGATAVAAVGVLSACGSSSSKTEHKASETPFYEVRAQGVGAQVQGTALLELRGILLEMTILVGAYATRRYLDLKSSASLTDVVRDYKRYLPTYFPLVHPSPRNQMWMKKNPWFAADVLPDLKDRVCALLA